MTTAEISTHTVLKEYESFEGLLACYEFYLQKQYSACKRL